MCGIVGYIGKGDAVPFLLQGLSKLEYRGYDSSGIAVCSGTEIKITKKQGRIKILEDALSSCPKIDATLGIGHTRWATHGNPSDVNAHPHLSSSGKIAIVHNGIIENYIELKDSLISKGYKFASETDTEVVVQLLDSLYNGDMFETIKRAVKMLDGSFALGVICLENPDILFAAKKNSPLIVGIGDGENYIASDIPAVLCKTRNICRLKEQEIAVIDSENVELFDFDGNLLEKNIITVDWNIDSAEKNNYEHFMMKEIMEQPQVIRATISPRLKNFEIILDSINLSKEYLEKIDKIFIVACGSAYHVGFVAKYFVEELIRKPVEVEVASEFRYRLPIVSQRTLVIIISQSGETADSLAALREAKKYGAKVLSIVNVVGSSIANESDEVLYTWAGPEIAVATTKAYSTQLVLMYLIALYIGKITKAISEERYREIISDIKTLPESIDEIFQIQDKIKDMANKYHKKEKVFFIGRNIDYAVCLEGSLKLKEISYVHSEAYAAGELKHGTISLIDDDTLVIALAVQNDLFDKTVSNIREVKARGAKVLAVVSEQNYEKILQVVDDVICIPNICDLITPSLTVVPLQFFAYHVAKYRKCDIDKPRNLAKSVTVE